MRIFVTGGAGFIGSNFVHHLLNKHTSDEIIVFDTLTYAGNLANLPSLSTTARLSFIQGDICDERSVLQALAGCDAIVHFAAETHVDRSLVETQNFIATNVQGTYVLLEAARKRHLQRFLYISTDEVYGNACSPAGVSRPSLESDSLRPLSPYAASKAGADTLAFSYWASYELPVTITRCSNNYGPYQYPEKQIPLFILNALEDRPLPIYGDGQHSRDWIHVYDHCAALDLLLHHTEGQPIAGEIFNIGAHQERSTLENATTILKVLEKPGEQISFVKDRLGHVRRHAVDTEKIYQQLGWQTQIPFDEGIKQTIDWYRNNTAWLADLKQKNNEFLQKALNLGL
ncbi:dTDP-glucose 4,6-dehydratase [Dictyobacter arantiisoli]|uniref:dTDP-glucose 4,6-dehydratase n=1 Tax=Dictyobacter arantiisoli TaxID=2014874 RepID=A0A5A5T6T8_9CHLR|nr:dTDP-glucose 4,6-dehydratase [Dictyobacter arantiisoli]GCF06896.1 dTDP-glucose 4,6-dehydratase [Dictyobacter arantiisoli]